MATPDQVYTCSYCGMTSTDKIYIHNHELKCWQNNCCPHTDRSRIAMLIKNYLVIKDNCQLCGGDAKETVLDITDSDTLQKLIDLKK